MQQLCEIPGSERLYSCDAATVGKPQPDEQVELAVYVRRPAMELELRTPERLEEQGQGRRRHLTHEEFAHGLGAAEADMDVVAAFAREHGLQVAATDGAKGVVKIAGTARSIMDAFGVEFVTVERGGRKFRSYKGSVRVTVALRDVITEVAGLDNHPIAREPVAPRLGTRDEPQPGEIASYSAPEVAAIYGFPADADGNGQCLGIIELGAGYFESDLDAYFAELGVAKPEIVAIGPNDPGTWVSPSHGYGEVLMDIEVAASIVPKAKIVVYFARENSQKGFMEVLQDAIHDPLHRPQVISVSWGESETEWTGSAAQQMRRIIAEGALLGVTVCVASGDNGALDGLPAGKLSVDFPAAVPEALACGGTQLVAKEGRIEREITWNDRAWKLASGGGVSIHFPLPDYQKKAGVPRLPAEGAFGKRKAGFAGRGVPDVSGNADPLTGYRLYILGKWCVDGGTSAVAPLWAALIIKLSQALGHRIGSMHGLLYGPGGVPVCRDVTEGNNGFYSAKPGWDCCTGLGSPNGTGLLQALLLRRA